MPFGRIVKQPDVQFESLLETLREEWEHPHDDASEPIIIETVDKVRPRKNPTHLYVIWNAWRDLSQQRRSEMIMDVYEAVRGAAFAIDVVMAMGLTPEEADCMEIRYALISSHA